MLLCLWGSFFLGWVVLRCFPCAYSEWYGYHFPELIKIVSDNTTYCRLARLIGNRKELSEESLAALEEVVMDGAKAQAILDASRSSMGECTSPAPSGFVARS